MNVRIAAMLDAATLQAARDFCRASAGYCYLQDPDWPALWQDGAGPHWYRHALVTRPDGSLMAYGVLRKRPLGAGYFLGAFRRGPVTAQPDDLGPALDALLPELRRQGCLALTLNPRWADGQGAAAETMLAARGARPAPPHRQRLHSRTGLIDLSPPPADILSACDAHARRQLRKIDRLGLTVRAADRPGDIEMFERWFDAFCRDRGLDRRGLPSLAAQQRWIGAHGGDCAMVEIDGAPVGAFTLLRDGPRLLNLSVAWADPGSRLPRSYIVYWHAIRRYGGQVRRGGPRWLDCAGRDDPRVPRHDPGAEGRERFKAGFPQRLVTLPRVHHIALRPVLSRAVEAVERRLAG